MPRAKLYETALKGLLRNYKEIYGAQAFAPHRRQPMLPQMWQRIENLPAGTVLPRRHAWDPQEVNLLPLGPAHYLRLLSRSALFLELRLHRRVLRSQNRHALSICIYLSIHPSVYLCICLSIYPTYLSICIYVSG